MADIYNPYIEIIAETSISLLPQYMGNNIKEHLKNSLIEKYVGKCFKNYGYVLSINTINDDDITEGKMIIEDATASPKYKLRFSCKICNPIKNKIIVGKIVGIHKLMIFAQNGPINIIIVPTNINCNNFYSCNDKNSFMVKLDGTKSKPLERNSYVKIRILSKIIIHKNENILVMGYMDSTATIEDWNLSIKQMYSKQKQIHKWNAKELVDNEENNDDESIKETFDSISI